MRLTEEEKYRRTKRKKCPKCGIRRIFKERQRFGLNIVQRKLCERFRLFVGEIAGDPEGILAMPWY